MAFYEYECGACNHRYEVQASMSEHEQWQRPPACPKCGKTESRQLVTSFSCKAPSQY
jgi:putative FmdB family regulatory protein